MKPGDVELVYAVPRECVLDGTGWRGVRRGDAAQAFRAIEQEGAFYPRSQAELDTSIKQIIPYVVVRDAERIFLMKRTRAGGDARLFDRFTIGVGGHMNPGDEGIMGTLEREWQEELVAGFMPRFDFLGLLNDDESDVGRHHLGFVYLADAAGRNVAVRETNKLSGDFRSLDEVLEPADRMETWSQLVVDLLSDRTFGPLAESNP